MLPSEKSIEVLAQRIVALVHPLRVILFGSAARAEAGPGSDVDLLVVVPEGTHRRQTAEYLYRNLRNTDVDFDLLIATPEDLETHGNNPGLIYQSVLAEGRELYAA